MAALLAAYAVIAGHFVLLLLSISLRKPLDYKVLWTLATLLST